jgi:hypothetical protein
MCVLYFNYTLPPPPIGLKSLDCLSQLGP